MKQYIYKPQDAGLSEWPSGTLRLDGIEATENPSEADVFVCPGNIRLFESSSGVLDRAKLNRLPYFKGNEARTVFFDVSDNFTKPVNLPIIFIRCDVRTWMLPHDVNTIQMAWPVEDFAECVELPVGGFKYDVSFQGWLSSQARIDATDSCTKNGQLRSDIQTYLDFFGYLKESDPEYARRRAEFRRSMKESRICLCPESIPGVLPYRFFEAMSAGRVPLLVGSEYVLPFSDEIPYDDFILSTTYPKLASDVALSFVRSYSDERIVEMGRMARHYWVKYLNAADWPLTMAYAVQKKLATMGVLA